MPEIKASVGRGGTNNIDDVLVVRTLLQRHRNWWFGSGTVSSTGEYDEALGTVIAKFQEKACALKTQDGRVDPNGFTLQRLNMPLIARPRHIVLQYVCVAQMPGKITDADYVAAALKLGCEAAAIKAVANVETKRSAFEDDGKPTILFERHLFRKHTSSRFNRTHRDISGPQGVYGSYSQQYPKLIRAAVLDEAAALKSAFWGTFQILGENYRQAGYNTVDAFVSGMVENEKKHLQAFVDFVDFDSRLKTALQNKVWATFARIYNGPGYRTNNYDTKMESEYRRLSASQ